MKNPYLRMILILGLAMPAAFALDNTDLIKMTKAGLPEETIVAAIKKEPAAYDTSADGLIALKKAGVSDAIVQQVLKASDGDRASGGQISDEAKAFAKEPSIAPPVIKPEVGKTYFTRSVFYYEKGTHLTTNYAVGTMVPINTEVTLVLLKKNRLELKRGDTQETVVIENVGKYTLTDIETIAGRLLAAEKTPLTKLNPVLSAAIESGTLRLGMTKEQVLMTRGYPPAHATPTIEGNTWVYWNNRFVKHTLVFKDGVLAEGRGLN